VPWHGIDEASFQLDLTWPHPVARIPGPSANCRPYLRPAVRLPQLFSWPAIRLLHVLRWPAIRLLHVLSGPALQLPCLFSASPPAVTAVSFL
jgi:hypothetical protein